MKAKKEKPDRPSIRLFAAFLREIGRPVNGVDCWPEDHAQGDIDALLGSFAVQHTSIDALPEGRAHDARFTQVIEGIESDFRGKLGFHLRLTLPWGSIHKGRDYRSINSAFRAWINNEARNLPDGRHHLDGVTGIPFTFDAIKGGPIKLDGPFFARYAPDDHSLGARLRDQLYGDNHDKLTPLARYRAEGCKTLVLLESHEIALISQSHVVQALEEAFPTWPEQLDELWFLHRASPTHVNFDDLCLGRSWIFEIATEKVTLHNPDTPQVGLWHPAAARPQQVAQ